jgi:rSAM/selenodomain-associated transferase 1
MTREMTRAARLLYIFARAPEPGRSKTRLITRLGAAGAAALHAAMIEDILGLSREVGARRVLAAADRPDHPFLVEMAAREGIPLVAQSEGDLGARMAAAIAAGLDEAERVCIVGSDSPTLGPAQIAAAFARLDAADVVLGPAEDGGYWLIGARRPEGLSGAMRVSGVLYEVLADTAWGTAAVLATTRARAEQAGLRVALAELHWDVDEPPDLERLGRVLAAEPARAPATRAALAALRA